MLAISMISALQSSLILGIALALGVGMANLFSIIPIMFIVIAFSLGFSGISVIVAAVSKSQETFWGVISVLGMRLFMLSPALFPLELLPNWLAFVARLNPVTYSVLLIRQMMTGTAHLSSIATEIGVICGFVAVMVALASYVFTREVNKPF